MRATLSVNVCSTYVYSSVAQGSFLSPGSYTGVFREKDAFQMLPLPSAGLSACSLLYSYWTQVTLLATMS